MPRCQRLLALVFALLHKQVGFAFGDSGLARVLSKTGQLCLMRSHALAYQRDAADDEHCQKYRLDHHGGDRCGADFRECLQ